MAIRLAKNHRAMVRTGVHAIQLVKGVMEAIIKAMEVNYGTSKAPLWRKVLHVTQWNILPTRSITTK